MTRTSGLGITLLVALLFAPAPGPAETVSLSEDLEVERLEPGLWLYRATFEMSIGPVESNGLIVEDGAGALIVDTPWSDELTRQLLDWVESRLGRVRAVIATHFHADRLGGLSEVHRRGVPSYAHALTRTIAAEQDLPLPKTTFSERMELRSEDPLLELFYPGPGHSRDNIVVWLPRHGVLFGGCLLKATAWKGLGFLGDAVVEEWGPSLETLLERYPEARVVVPGHGDLGGLEVVRHTLELVRQKLEGDGA